MATIARIASRRAVAATAAAARTRSTIVAIGRSSSTSAMTRYASSSALHNIHPPTAVRSMSTTTPSPPPPTSTPIDEIEPVTIDVWEAVRVMRAPDVTTQQRIDVIDAFRVDAPSVLEKQKQALTLVESDAIAALLEFLQDADSTEASELLVPAFLALIRLASQPLIVQELLRLDAMPLLAHFLTLSDPRLQAAASLTLGLVAHQPEASDAVSDPHVLASVLHLLASKHEAIQRAGATCVANVAGHAAVRTKLLAATDALGALSHLLTSEQSDAMRSAAAFALGNLLSDRDMEAQDALRENGALADLVQLLSPSFSEDVSSSAAWAIHHSVALNSMNQMLVADAGGLALLVTHLSAATAQLQTNALLALASAIDGHTVSTQWCRDQGVDATLKQIETDDGDDMDGSAKRALQQIRDAIASN